MPFGKAEDEDRWITVKPNGEENKGRSGSEIRVMDSAIKSRMVFDSMDLGTFTQDFNNNHNPENGQFAKKGTGESGKNDTQSEKEELYKSPTILKSKEEVRAKALETTKDKTPIIDIKNNEFSGADIKSKREAAKQYYNDNLKGHPFKNKNSGQTIICGDVGKSFHESGYEDKINSFKYLPDILEQSEYLGANKDVQDRPDIKAFHYYACKVKTPKDEQILIMSVRELKDGKFYYNHHITQEQGFKLPALQSGTQNPVKDSITDNLEKINIHYWGIFPDTKRKRGKTYERFEKNNGASGQDTAPEQEEGKMDKRDVIHEIMAICAKPDNFKNTYEFEQVADLLRRFGFAF